MAPSAVNNAGRADEGLLARWHKDTNASKASTGSANAYVFAADQTLSAYYDGLVIAFDANFENTAAATLNVDAVSADTIKKHNDQDLVAGDIEASQKVWVIHDGTFWQMISPTARGGSPITTRGDVERGDSSGDPERLALGTTDQVLLSDGTDVVWAAAPLELARGYIDGLILSNNTLDATNDIDIAVGESRSTADDTDLVVSSAIGKQIDVSFAAGGTPGTTTGGLSSSLTLTNDTWYHVILGKVSGTVEVGFDTSITGANLVTDHTFTNTRRIGSVRRGTATNLAFHQAARRFYLAARVQNVNDTTPGTSANLATMTTPLGVEVLGLFAGHYHDTADSHLIFTGPDETDSTPSISNHDLRVNSGSNLANTNFSRKTDTSSQIRYRSDRGTVTQLRIWTLGWEELD